VAGVYAMVVLSFGSNVDKRESIYFSFFIGYLFNGLAVARTACCSIAGRVMNSKV
jgi:hypothetical protein